MSSYRFRLNNYHAISSADIAIDGLTVLSGVNGCGKSTISRWLYYLVNGSQRYEDFVSKRFINTLLAYCRKYDRVRHEMNFNNNTFIISVNKQKNTEENTYISPNAFQRFELKDRFDEDGAELTAEYFNKFIDYISNTLETFLASGISDASKKRVLRFLNNDVDPDREDVLLQHSVDEFRTASKNFLQEALQKRALDLKNRPIPLLYEAVKDEYEYEVEEPKEMDLTEDGVSIMDGNRLAVLLGLRRAIYVDTPLAVVDSTWNRFWAELRNYMNTKSANIDIEGKKLLRRVKDTLQGEVRFVKSDLPFDIGELHFFNADNSVEIPINDTATGFKTFIYLQRLIENGHLDDETLFLLDEPEVHLHPQWIVEYAKLLVLLHKKLGVKIVLATHNPDMVAAIQSIAEREMVLDKTHFYIAEPGHVNGTYNFKDLGSDIEEIFSSFNIALERIALYGGNNLR